DPGEEEVAGTDAAIGFSWRGAIGEAGLGIDTEPLARFLTQRALEREQERVEYMQAVLLERQRLRRDLEQAKEQTAQRAAEAERIRREEEEAERRRQQEAAEAAARARAEEEERRRAAEEEARRRLQQNAIPPLEQPIVPAPQENGAATP